MITGLRIKNLRGIRVGELTGLSGLTILLGPNGSGKSAILDALLIGGSYHPADAIGRAVRRRVSASAGGRWLLWKSGSEGPAQVEILNGGDGAVLSIWDTPGEAPTRASGTLGNYALRVQEGQPASELPAFGYSARIVFAYGDGNTAPRTQYDVVNVSDHRRENRFVRMIDPAPGGNQADLGKVFDGLKEAGRKEAANALLRDVVDDFNQLDSLHDDDGHHIVGIAYAGAAPRTVPVALAGDGIYVLTRIALELALCPSGLALIEEPEIHQYPKSLWRTAKAITDTVARGVQVVVSTHSVELIRMLLEQANERQLLEQTSVVNVLLKAGQLVSSRIDGTDALLAVDSFGEDLR